MTRTAQRLSFRADVEKAQGKLCRIEADILWLRTCRPEAGSAVHCSLNNACVRHETRRDVK